MEKTNDLLRSEHMRMHIWKHLIPAVNVIGLTRANGCLGTFGRERAREREREKERGQR